MTNDYLIQGAGGGKGGGGGAGRVAVESPDSLRSRQYARVLDLVCEGEIEGLVDGMKSIYLDETPLQNADGTYNFSGASVVVRTGTQTQAFIPGFGAVESENAVGVEVKYATPVTRQITNANIDAVRVTISVPQLSEQDTSNGDLRGASVAIAIDVQTNGGGYVEALADTLAGKTMSRYQRSYRIPVSGTGPWDIRVRRVTADSTSTALNNKTFWDACTEIIDQKLAYPNSAIVGISVDASQFQAVPRRGYDLKLLKVRIPGNYDPVARTYTGAWDGTFTVAWTDNPAWCWYDLVTNDRYGLGEFIAEGQVDKWALYSIAQYCDAIVPDGFGGFEPRFTCNLYLQTREEAYKVINSLASVFRAITYWAAGAITAVQDAPADPIALFTAANVIDGLFGYTGTALKTRHTIAKVTWNDPADGYRQKVEYVEDAASIARYGVVESDFVAVGCTSRGQAHRIGKWLLYTERMETEVITFRTGLEGAAVYPGAVITTQDAARSGKRFGGRVLTATAAEITLDAAVTIESGKTYALSVMLPDGSIEERALGNAPGSTTTLAPATAFSAAPQQYAIWVLAASDLAPETWRVMTVAETEKATLEITALKHHPEKYAFVEQDLEFEPTPTTSLSLLVSKPYDLRMIESLYLAAPGVVGAMATLSWAGDAPRYRVAWRTGSENWQTQEVNTATAEVKGVAPGVYDFAVTPLNALGAPGTPATLAAELYGKLLPPTDIAGLSIQTMGGLALLTWAQSPDLDVRVGGRIRFRHSDASTGATWQGSVSIGEAVSGATTVAVLPLKAGTYLAKAEDASGILSVNAAAASTKQASVLAYSPAGLAQEDDEFSGAHAGTVGIDGVLKLAGAVNLDDVADLDALVDFDAAGGILASGTYGFAAGLDLGSVQRVRLTGLIQAQIVNVLDKLDARATPIDAWSDFDGTQAADCDAWIEARETDDDPAGAPTWTAWRRLDASEYDTRGFQFRARLASADPAYNIHLTQLRVTAAQLA